LVLPEIVRTANTGKKFARPIQAACKRALGNACRTDRLRGRLGFIMTMVWQTLDLVRVPACPAGFWTLVQEYVPGVRLLRIQTSSEDQQKKKVPMLWSPETGIQCGPDGAASKTAVSGMLCNGAACGALIGKVGGSTGDLPDSTAGTAGPYGNKKVFAVGTDSIIALPTAADGGPLFLSMNDKPDEFPKHSGELFVRLQYYLL
jgi:hypothetical protein